MEIKLIVQRSAGNPPKYTLTRQCEGEHYGSPCNDTNGSPIKELNRNLNRTAFYGAVAHYRLDLEGQGHQVTVKTPSDEFDV